MRAQKEKGPTQTPETDIALGPLPTWDSSSEGPTRQEKSLNGEAGLKPKSLGRRIHAVVSGAIVQTRGLMLDGSGRTATAADGKETTEGGRSSSYERLRKEVEKNRGINTSLVGNKRVEMLGKAGQG